MSISPEQLSALLRSRRSVFPKSYNNQPIPKEIIENVLENANTAPTHKVTEPWRFKVFAGESLKDLSQYLGDYYVKGTTPETYSEIKHKNAAYNPLHSGCAIAICVNIDPSAGLPEWEEIAATSCAVQNMWLTCTTYGIGCYWSSPKPMLEAKEFLQLGEHERCLGVFYMGYSDMPTPPVPPKRTSVDSKVVWR